MCIQERDVAAIAVGCFVGGSLLGIVGTVIVVQCSVVSSHRRRREHKRTVERLEDASLYEMPMPVHSQPVYADPQSAEQQIDTLITSNPAYVTSTAL